MKADKINQFYFHDVNTPPVQIDRREFLKNLGGGIIIIFSVAQLGFRWNNHYFFGCTTGFYLGEQSNERRRLSCI